MTNQRLDRLLPDAPASGNSLSSNSSYDDPQRRPPAPHRRRHRPPNSHNHKHSPSLPMIRNSTFKTLLLALLLLALLDTLYLWSTIDDLESDHYRDGGPDDPLPGPEAGMHHLHESRRIGSLYENILAKMQLKHGLAGLFEREEDLNAAIARAHTAKPNLMTDDGAPGLEGVPVAAAAGDADGGIRDNLDGNLVRRGEGDNSSNNGSNSDNYGVDPHIVKILRAANVEIDEELASQLPTWRDITSQYGDKPIIRGLETCQPYRDAVPASHRMIGPAGLFNTGTNLLFELMKTNCDIKEARAMNREPRKNGMRWQVPWGKHNPPSTHRLKNVAKAWGKGINHEEFMPVVLIKDPYHWMGSQCRHKYTTFWGHDEQHCPNLIRWRVTERDEPSEVRVKFALNMETYESLLDMWNTWNSEWEEQTFPALHTRFEDLLFHGEEVVRTACECVGGVFTKRFQYVEESAKRTVGVHKGANGLVKAMLQYGDPNKRLNGFTDRDRWYASKNVRTELMEKYNYVPPPLPS